MADDDFHYIGVVVNVRDALVLATCIMPLSSDFPFATELNAKKTVVFTPIATQTTYSDILIEREVTWSNPKGAGDGKSTMKACTCFSGPPIGPRCLRP